MSVNPKPSVSRAPLLKGTANSPFVFFDGVPCFGVLNNIVELELSVSGFSVDADQNVKREMVSAAHLRTSVEGALSLYSALGKALKMAKVTIPPETAVDLSGTDDRAGRHLNS